MYILAICEAIACYFCLSLGFVLQKKGIGWIGHTGPKDKSYQHSLIIWILGFIFMNLAVLPNFLALRVLNAYVVNAISGLNIVFLVFLSRFLLGETIIKTDYIYSGLMLAAIVGVNLIDQRHSGNSGFSQPMAYFFAALPIAFFVIYLLIKTLKSPFAQNGNIQAIFMATLGGGMSGYAVTLLKILELQHGTRFAAYLTSPYFYSYFGVSVLSFLALQMAYKSGRMIIVGPVQYAMTVFYPILASYPIFSLRVNPLQIIFFALIIGSVVMMVTQHHND